MSDTLKDIREALGILEAAQERAYGGHVDPTEWRGLTTEEMANLAHRMQGAIGYLAITSARLVDGMTRGVN